MKISNRLKNILFFMVVMLVAMPLCSATDKKMDDDRLSKSTMVVDPVVCLVGQNQPLIECLRF